MTEPTDDDPQQTEYGQAIESYKVCRRALSECQIDIEVAQMEKDTDKLRVALSVEHNLRCNVDYARQKVKEVAYEIVRRRGMVRNQPEKPKAGLLQKIIKIVQS